MSIHNTPATLSKAIGNASKRVTAVSYEYPGYWLIETREDTYSLGDAEGEIGWNDLTGYQGDYLEGSTEYTAPAKIAKAFAEWLQKVEAN